MSGLNGDMGSDSFGKMCGAVDCRFDLLEVFEAGAMVYFDVSAGVVHV